MRKITFFYCWPDQDEGYFFVGNPDNEEIYNQQWSWFWDIFEDTNIESIEFALSNPDYIEIVE